MVVLLFLIVSKYIFWLKIAEVFSWSDQKWQVNELAKFVYCLVLGLFLSVFLHLLH